MKPLDVLLALLVALTWGLAFVFTKIALDAFSPPMLLAIRFALAALPVVLLAPPQGDWRLLLALGLTLFAGQFLFQFIGMANGVPPGLAALIVQSQALFTVGLAAAVLRQVPTPRQGLALMVATLGFLCITGTVGVEFDLAGLLLMLLSPLCFAVGNLLLARLAERDMLRLMVWLSLVPPLPGLGLALATQGSGDVWREIVTAPWAAWLSVLYLGVVGTTIAYAVWGRLLARYPAPAVAPFALLVPFVGAAASAVFLGETFGPLRLAGMLLVLAGLAILVLPWRDTWWRPR